MVGISIVYLRNQDALFQLTKESAQSATLHNQPRKGMKSKMLAVAHNPLNMKTKWKSIKSAPKDGTRVLLYGKFDDGRGYMKTGFYDGSPRISDYSKWYWGLVDDPTHWMELPDAPKK